jgi:SpoVK/Ycf46/Vps4 family AAA+-type ATPase
LEREMVVLDYSLPDRDQLGVVLDGICDSAKLKKLKDDDRDLVLDSASGLTSTEAENAFALSVVEAKKIDPGIVAREKAATVKKNGVLEIVTVKETLDSIGGLDVLKGWLVQRKDAFSARAREYGLPSPKGLLIVGIPGTGKSLTAKATARILGRPLIKLDAGRLFGGLVGQSEGNLRAALATAEAIAPCVLWIDEIEKGFSGSKSSGSTDGGTSARVFGGFISWMQERTKPVFVVATANDVTALPLEFLRKGRWDDLFFVDLPNQEEREAIWRIQVLRHGRDWSHYDTVALAKASDGYTGAEIEQAVIDALYAGFAAGREPSMPDILKAVADTVPLSKLMGEQIAGLRKWAVGRCRMATAPAKEEKGRKIAA